MKHKLIVIGTSFGGTKALQTILPVLPGNFPLPIAIVQHLSPDSDNSLVSLLDDLSRIMVKEAEEKESLKPGVAYFAPANYHLLVEEDMTLSLSVEKKVNYSRPAIDVLFESAAYSIGSKVVGIILTGANTDGSCGLNRIKANGGLAIVQSLETAEATAMPQGAIDTVPVDFILPLPEISPFLVNLYCNR